MNKILEEIILTGTTKTIEGEPKKVIAQISSEEGKLIHDCINDIQAEVSVEVGLAFGTSALYICDSLVKSDKTKHYVIDPYQMYEASYGGIGLNNLKKAGYESIIEFIDKPSHLALPGLESRGIKVDFAFIDGWHTFDHALVDFFLTDKILRVGGIVIIDDSDWSAVQKVCSFISKNRSYEFISGSPQRSHLKKNISKISKVKNYFSGSSDTAQKLYGAIAFKKQSEDKRSWDHFEEF